MPYLTSKVWGKIYINILYACNTKHTLHVYPMMYLPFSQIILWPGPGCDFIRLVIHKHVSGGITSELLSSAGNFSKVRK